MPIEKVVEDRGRESWWCYGLHSLAVVTQSVSCISVNQREAEIPRSRSQHNLSLALIVLQAKFDLVIKNISCYCSKEKERV